MTFEEVKIKELKDITEIVSGDQCYLREIWHTVNDQMNIHYSLAYAFILPSGRTLNHYLSYSETYFIISGSGLMHAGETTFKIKNGTSFCIQPFMPQWIENTGDIKLEFLVIVDPAWNKKEEVILES